MGAARIFVVWAICLFVLLVPFTIVASVGWPTTPDDCTNIVDGVQTPPPNPRTGQPDWDHPDTCYCEKFTVADVNRGAPGLRQPINTLSNLYAIFTSLILAFRIYYDRKSGEVRNALFYTQSWIPEIWIFAVMFLGLGSMWFHASLAAAVSWLDSMSMYVFASFLLIYTIQRRVNMKFVFYIAYPAVVIGFTIAGIVKHDTKNISMLLIGILVIAYVLAEIGVAVADTIKLGGTPTWWRRFRDDLRAGWGKRAIIFWMIGACCFAFATMFQINSQTGKLLCSPTSWFQPHGLLWHTLAGAMAVFMHLYWRELRDEDRRLIT